MDHFAEDEVEYATINRTHNTLSQPVITELKNKFHYEIQDSESEEETSTEGGSSSAGSGSTGSGSTIAEGEEEEESEEDNNDAASIGSAASLLDFSDMNKERRVTQALNTGEGANPDTMSICSTDVADIVQRQLAEFSMTLRRQIESDMQSLMSKKMNPDDFGSQPALPPPTPSRKKHMRTKSEEALSTKRKVSVMAPPPTNL